MDKFKLDTIQNLAYNSVDFLKQLLKYPNINDTDRALLESCVGYQERTANIIAFVRSRNEQN